MRFMHPTCLVAALVPSLAAAQAIPLQPGEYEVVATIATSSTPQESKVDTNKRCITAEDLTNAEAVFNNRFGAGFKADASCKVSGLSISNGRISYSSDCKYALVRVDGTLTDDSFSVVRTARSKAAGGVDVTTRLRARRVKGCT